MRQIIVATADEGRVNQLSAAFSGVGAELTTLSGAGVKEALPSAGLLQRARFVFDRTRASHPVSWVLSEASDPRRGILLLTPLEVSKVFRGKDALARVRAYLGSLPRN